MIHFLEIIIIVLNNNSSSSVEMNKYYETLIELSNTFPASYGLILYFSCSWIGNFSFHVIRRSASNYKKKLSSKKAAW